VLSAGQALLHCVFEGVLGLTAHAADVRESVTVYYLLLREGRNLLWIIDIVVAGVQIFDRCHCVVSPARATFVLVLHFS
jgi:hypothetical protein